jgi:hypothetical protein
MEILVNTILEGEDMTIRGPFIGPLKHGLSMLTSSEGLLIAPVIHRESVMGMEPRSGHGRAGDAGHHGFNQGLGGDLVSQVPVAGVPVLNHYLHEHVVQSAVAGLGHVNISGKARCARRDFSLHAFATIGL